MLTLILFNMADTKSAFGNFDLLDLRTQLPVEKVRLLAIDLALLASRATSDIE